MLELVKPAFQQGDFALTVLSRQMREPTVHLKEASVIVAGGAGATDPEDFQLVASWRTCWAARWGPRVPQWTPG